MNLICQRGQTYEYREEETGAQFFSVSQVRKVMWDGLAKVPPKVLEQARQRGEALHVYFSVLLGSRVGVCEPPAILPEYEGYCRAINAWADQYQVRALAIEEPSCNRTLGIAGTRDADVELPRLTQLATVDLKTGEPTPTDAVQLMAYQSMERAPRRGHLYDLYVRADGRFVFQEVVPIRHERDWVAFLNALQILKWRAGR